VLHKAGHPEEDIQGRFELLRGRPELLGGAPQYDRFLNLLRVQLVCLRGRKSGQPHAELTAAREASAILDRYQRDTSLDPRSRLWIAYCSLDVSVRLRKGGAVAEALRLLEPTNRTLQELVRGAPQDPGLFVRLSDSWHQIGKAHWDLDRVEETLDACRRALAAQRQACTLAPPVTQYRQELGKRYLQLGRKLCELGRLHEAETCFRERQAHGPGEAARHAEGLAELRKWAAEAGKESSPEKRQERQRYLDLCARLEGNRVGALPVIGNAKP
jgi:tetratricopeptide (TPR) repeat protein